jgi:YegS/Rv2252/BmrU family lipid kinase
MKKAALIYNPFSGQSPDARPRRIAAVCQALREGGIGVLEIATEGPGSAGEQAREAIRQGCDTVLACGGDGTVHEVLQGLVGAPEHVVLGVVPLGTANALATDLGLPHDPVRAARAMLHGSVRRMGVGKIEYQERSGRPATRYFMVTAGVGADAHLMYRLNADFKRRHGMSAYYLQAAWIWATHHYVPYQVEFFDLEAGVLRRERVTQVLAVRVADFGGILKRLAPGAGLHREDFRLVLFKTSSRARYLMFVIRTMLRRNWAVPGVELASATWCECRPLAPAEARGSAPIIRAEADGEMLGHIPARITMVPNAVNLLTPKQADADSRAIASCGCNQTEPGR